jgi:hypothetical protein
MDKVCQNTFPKTISAQIDKQFDSLKMNSAQIDLNKKVWITKIHIFAAEKTWSPKQFLMIVCF